MSETQAPAIVLERMAYLRSIRTRKRSAASRRNILAAHKKGLVTGRPPVVYRLTSKLNTETSIVNPRGKRVWGDSGYLAPGTLARKIRRDHQAGWTYLESSTDAGVTWYTERTRIHKRRLKLERVQP